MNFLQNRFLSGRLGFLGQGGSELGLEFWNYVLRVNNLAT